VEDEVVELTEAKALRRGAHAASSRATRSGSAGGALASGTGAGLTSVIAISAPRPSSAVSA
jgi:hypothetical protein